MPFTLSLLLLTAAAPPAESLRLLMVVGDAPAGVVEARREGKRWVYRSTHLYRAGPAERRRTLEVDAAGKTRDGKVPETWWLSRLREVGCVDAVEELELSPERVCVRERKADGRETVVEGRIGETPFRARYGKSGALLELTVNEVAFRASDAPLPEGVDPFATGFPLSGQASRGTFRYALTGGDASLEDAVEAAREVDDAPVGREPAATTDCLTAARALVKARPGLSLVLGVVTEDGRAWPHAWAEDAATHRAVDPTLPPHDARLTRRRYLAFPKDAGRLYLALLAGTVKVTQTSKEAGR